MATTETRHPPRQARASAKRQRILRAAEALLAERAASEITTRAVAEEAAVPVGSVYRYFANIDDLLGALFDDLNAGTLSSICHLSADGSSWRAQLADIMRVVEEMHRKHPSYGTLMRHLSARGEDDGPIVEALTGRFLERVFPGDVAKAQNVAATVIAIISGIERRYHAAPTDRRSEVFAEGQKAVEAYLATYLD